MIGYRRERHRSSFPEPSAVDTTRFADGCVLSADHNKMTVGVGIAELPTVAP
jgi:hypothetical protein